MNIENAASANAAKQPISDWSDREINMNKLMVLPPGSPVEIGVGADRIRADVTAVCIYPHNIQYQVVWWDGRTRKQEWVNDHEVLPLAEADKLPVGFA